MTRPGPVVETLTLPGEPASVTTARHRLVDRLGAQGLDGDIRDTAALLLTEVVTNAVLHAGTDVTVRWSVETGSVLVEVRDDSAVLPVRRDHDDDAVTGRGLELVELLAGAYGVRRTATGKAVWFAVGSSGAGAEHGWGPLAPDETRVVRLLGVPLGLYDVLQQHNEALLKEYELLRLARSADVAERQDLQDAGRARVLLASTLRSADSGVVELKIPVDVAAGFRLLPRVLDAAEDAARRGDLLTRPALPELLDFRGWLYDQVNQQLSGQSPEPFAVDVATHTTPSTTAPPLVDVAWVTAEPGAVVAADDGNQVLAASPGVASLLGWEPAHLVGRRVTVLIPADMRVAHVTGFTRYLVTGRTSIIGHDVAVPALHRDGHHVPVVLHIERLAVGDRVVFVARMTPEYPEAAR